MITTRALPESQAYALIQREVVALLESARSAAARSVNALMTSTYWEIGRRITEFEQAGQERAGYGDALLGRLASDLSSRFGQGFRRQNLQQMPTFYQYWPVEKICQTLSGKCVHEESSNLSILAQVFRLPWSAYVRLISVKNAYARDFYEAEALRCGWSVRQLDRQIGSQFYERTALSTNQAAMLTGAKEIEASDILPSEQSFKDPFVLEFLTSRTSTPNLNWKRH